MLGSVELRGLRCVSEQGDPPTPTELVADVRITVDLDAVAESDAYADVVDLTDLAATTRQLVAGPPRLLLETITVQLARQLLARYALVEEVVVRVAKREPAGLDAAEEAVEVRLVRARPAD